LIERYEVELSEARSKADEEMQGVRQELGEALEQVLQATEQYEELDKRKKEESAVLIQQLEQAHEALEDMARKANIEMANLHQFGERETARDRGFEEAVVLTLFHCPFPSP